jgi:hypothetical protein
MSENNRNVSRAVSVVSGGSSISMKAAGENRNGVMMQQK